MPEVSSEDLGVWRAAINSAYHHNFVLDMADGYRRLNNRQPASALTKALDGAMKSIDEHIAKEDNDVS